MSSIFPSHTGDRHHRCDSRFIFLSTRRFHFSSTNLIDKAYKAITTIITCAINMTSFNETDAANVNGLLMRGGFNSVEPSVVYSVLSKCGGNSIAAAKFISDQHAEAFVGSSSSPALPSAGEGYNANFPALPSIPRKERAGNTNKLQARRSRPSPLP